jgi:hypothetical protein
MSNVEVKTLRVPLFDIRYSTARLFDIQFAVREGVEPSRGS